MKARDAAARRAPQEVTHVLGVCAGVGGLELGVQLACGGATRLVAAVEIEAYAAAVLAARMEDGALDPAPIWSDLRTFDARPWRGTVDLITAGYPCQPYSQAGKRRGHVDARHLWPHVRRVVAEAEPAYVYGENVAAHLSRGFDVVCRDLAALGYRVAATLWRASECGAPHRRERLYWLAVADRGGERQPLGGPAHDTHGRDAPGHVPDRCGAAVGFPPQPDDAAGWRSWLAGGGPAPAVRGGATRFPARVDRLRACGNGVVPIVAAHALRELALVLGVWTCR